MLSQGAEAILDNPARDYFGRVVTPRSPKATRHAPRNKAS
jgi:hypothetical protein